MKAGRVRNLRERRKPQLGPRRLRNRTHGPSVLFIVACASIVNSFMLTNGWSIEERPMGVIYISAEPGCYTPNLVGSKTISMAPPKKVYRVDCSSKHHYEVFWSGKFKTRSGNPIPNSKESASYCLKKSNELKYYSRDSSAYNFGPNETIGVGNWLADKGPEAARFPKRLVCYVGLSTNEFRTFKEVQLPLIRGLG
jgi:hypothetical protein